MVNPINKTEEIMRNRRQISGPLALAVIFLAALCLHAQQAAEMKVDNAGAIEAGDTVTFIVMLDKAANVDVGSVSLSVEAERQEPDVPAAGGSAGPANLEKTEFKIPVRIPVTAHHGKWRVSSVYLSLGNVNKPLAFDSTSFEVKERTPLILPGKASIKIVR
jgi:hypothetical protein